MLHKKHIIVTFGKFQIRQNGSLAKWEDKGPAPVGVWYRQQSFLSIPLCLELIVVWLLYANQLYHRNILCVVFPYWWSHQLFHVLESYIFYSTAERKPMDT